MNKAINIACIELFMIAGFFGGFGIAFLPHNRAIGVVMIGSNLGYGLLTAITYAYNNFRAARGWDGAEQ